MNRIRDANKLVDVYGAWPTFEDAEIVSVALDRGNHKEIVVTGDWASRVAPSMTAKAMVFDSRYGNVEDCKYRLVTLRFNGLNQFNMQWFSYQNPIMGIGLRMEIAPGQIDPSIHVEWGDTAMGHEADFYCDSIDVLSIESFLPPRLQKNA
jgi:Immunity protein 50